MQAEITLVELLLGIKELVVKKKSHKFYQYKEYKGIIICTLYNPNANSFISLNFNLKKKEIF